MSVELERRFLVAGESWRSLVSSVEHLRQGYLAVRADGFTVRVRISSCEKAWLTLKAPAEGIACYEFEYLIPLDDAEALWEFAPNRISKTRYKLKLQGGDWIIDCFSGANYPLVLAEVELRALGDHLQVPQWCCKEITGETHLSNAALARMPITSWPIERKKSLALGNVIL